MTSPPASRDSPQSNLVSGDGTQAAVFTMSANPRLDVESVVATIDNSGGGDIQPLLTIRDSSGVVIATKRQVDIIPAGDTGTATFALRLDDEVGEPSPLVTLRNLGVLGYNGSGTQGTTYQLVLLIEPALTGDRILVLAMAPSKPSALGAIGQPVSCTDTNGNVYTQFAQSAFEANPPNVNEGVYVVLFISDPITEPLVVAADGITVTWDNPVFDRSVAAWLVRHVPSTPEPFWLNATNDNDVAVFASTQMTLRALGYTPDRNNTLYLALLISAKVGGTGAFSSVVGWDGFFQDTVNTFAGSKQTYRLNQQTYGADATFIFDGANPRYEVDLGRLDAGVHVFPFNGVGQNYSLGANAWKGIELLVID